MAVNQRILPPLAGCTDPNPAFGTEAPALFPLVNGEIRDPSEKMRAGAQAMGFGGINCHVAIESADAPSSKLTPSQDVRTMMASYQDTEVFVLSADSAVDLATRARDVADLAVPLSVAELLDFSAKLSRVISPTALPCRSGGRTSRAVGRTHASACRDLRELRSCIRSGEGREQRDLDLERRPPRHRIPVPGTGIPTTRDGARADRALRVGTRTGDRGGRLVGGSWSGGDHASNSAEPGQER